MSISQSLEVAVGLIFIYYVLGSIVSMITQWINEALETRGIALQRYLVKIVGDKNLDDLINLPQIQALRPIRYKNALSVFSSATEPKLVEKIPVNTLVDAYFDMVGFTGKAEVPLLELAEMVDKLPESEGKQALIRWINQGVTNISDLRARTTAYFTGILDQAASTFRSNARSFVIMLSIGITLLFGTDSIQLAKGLWSNAELRAVAMAKADMVVAEEGANASLDELVKELGDLSIRVGWWQTERPANNATPQEWAWFIGLKVLGLSLTAMAVSQGSSFWYDLLKKISSPTKAIKSPGGDSAEAKG